MAFIHLQIIWIIFLELLRLICYKHTENRYVCDLHVYFFKNTAKSIGIMAYIYFQSKCKFEAPPTVKTTSPIAIIYQYELPNVSLVKLIVVKYN